MSSPLPRFEIARRVRPVALVQPEPAVDLEHPDDASDVPCPRPAPYAAAVLELDGHASLTFASGSDELTATVDRDRVGLSVTTGGRTTRHHSRRHAKAPDAGALALTITGTHLTAFTCVDDGPWTARARVDLSDRVDTRDPEWCGRLRVSHRGRARGLRAGAFGQLGLRDIRLVTKVDGSPYAPDGRVLLTATSAGPGFFDTAHASVWELDPVSLDLQHRSDLFFRRDTGRVFGDHAIHLVRDDDSWIAATSTWGDFDTRREGARVEVRFGRSGDDLLSSEHVIETEPLVLPTDGLASVGVWDPHLVRTDGQWLVGFVSAREYFDFYPALATGPSLDELTLRGAATDRHATEGTTLHRIGDQWRVMASDGRDNRRGRRERFPVFDLEFQELGILDAHYPTNIPWPTVVPRPDGDLLVGFNGAPHGGKLLGYGTHGAAVIARAC